MKLSEKILTQIKSISEDLDRGYAIDNDEVRLLLHAINLLQEAPEKAPPGTHRIRVAVVVGEPQGPDGEVEWNACGWESDSRKITDKNYDAEMETFAIDTIGGDRTRTSYIEADVPLPEPRESETIQGRIT